MSEPDVVKRLRRWIEIGALAGPGMGPPALVGEAADEIERLRAAHLMESRGDAPNGMDALDEEKDARLAPVLEASATAMAAGAGAMSEAALTRQLDEEVEALIRAQVDALNHTIEEAHDRGLGVSLSITCRFVRPRYDMVRLLNIERPIDRRTGKPFPAPEREP